MKALLKTSIIAATLTLSLTGCLPNTNVPAPGGTGSTNEVVTQGAYTVTKPEYLWVGGAECINLIDADPTVENLTANALAGVTTFCDENRSGEDYVYNDVPGDIYGVVIPTREGGLPWKVAFFSVPAKDLIEVRTPEFILSQLNQAMNQTNADHKYCVLPPSVPGNSDIATNVGLVRGWMSAGESESGCPNFIDPNNYGATVGSETTMLMTDVSHQYLSTRIEYYISLHP